MSLFTKSTSFSRFAWTVVAYTIAVILWGAYVRATGSGAGCGSHWPLCNGEILPRHPDLETLIEYAHRLSSGIAFLLVVVLLIWAFKMFPARSPVRTAALFSFLFMLTEALVGAGLVIFGLVAQNDSFARAWVMAFHLVNTFLLLASLALTAWWGSGAATPKISGASDVSSWLALLLGGFLLLGISGAIAALGDTLFPASTLAEALEEDLSPQAHLLIQLRIYHPMLAFLMALLVMPVTYRTARLRRRNITRRLAQMTVGLFFLQLALGLVNLLLLAPVWLQISHLFLADALWVVAVLLSADAIS